MARYLGERRRRPPPAASRQGRFAPRNPPETARRRGSRRCTNTASKPMRAAPSMSVCSAVADRQHLVLRRIAGAGAAHGRRSPRCGLPYQVDPAAEPLVEVGDRAGAGLGNAAADHHPVGVEAMHVARRGSPSARARRDSPRDRAALPSRPVQARSVKSSPSAIAHAPALEDRAVAARADEADRLAERVERLDPRFAAGRDRSPRQSRGRPMRASCCFDRIGGARRIGDQDDAAALVAPLRAAARPRRDRASRRRGRRPRCRTGSAGIWDRACPRKLIRGPPRRAPARSARHPRDC